MDKYNYKRRKTREARVGETVIGGDNPIRVQSMANTSTLDTERSVAQASRIVEAGGEIVRFTTQGVREAENLGEIRKKLRQKGVNVPLVADVHFNPAAAMKAAETCEKVRINPGNFADAARTFKKLEFTDEEYAKEKEKIRGRLVPFLNLCKENGTAIRLGVNHGSLSDRIMSRYGDTPKGMVESVIEYLEICREENFNDIVISIKSSNVKTMVETVKLLVEEIDRRDMRFPIHLGVTEAGDGEDGRVKSAVGIGTLLGLGIGDTLRVSLTEDPECEIPVAIKLRDYIVQREDHEPIKSPSEDVVTRKNIQPVLGFEDVRYPVVIGHDVSVIPAAWHKINVSGETYTINDSLPIILETDNKNRPGSVAAWIDSRKADFNNPVIVKFSYEDDNVEDVMIKAAADFGPLLLDGKLSGIWIDAPHLSSDRVSSIALSILQACRLRVSKTEYIACPGCGRTLFDLQETLKKVKEKTGGLKGLKIGVMGCIVNGPGEMADADYGYVGAGVGKVSLYKGKNLIKKNIPAENALPELIELIKENGDWKE